MENYKEILIDLSVLLLAGIIAALIKKFCLLNQDTTERDAQH